MGKEIKKDTLHAEGIEISIYTNDYENEFISLTDIAKKREGEYPGYVIQNWMRNRSVISFIGLWEALHNPRFNCLEFEAIKNEAGDNGFVMTPKREMRTAVFRLTGISIVRYPSSIIVFSRMLSKII